ncbi:MAG: TetR family transcriptional regulator [Methylobacteriaceae bacterium]|jgi:TetR/AcrR family acrAB operon transcriptional repressor|nr:TetR family transcriptional regulator [Methylobacteriaceae bacterium]
MKHNKADTEKTREAILNAAEKLFLQNGVNTSLEKIAREAGCTRGAVHWHFGNKNGLFLALAEREQTPVQELMAHLDADDSLDPLAALLDTNDRIFARMEQEPGRRQLLRFMFKLLFLDLPGAPGAPEGYAAVDACARSRGAAGLTMIFEIAEQRGQLSPEWPAKRAALAFYSMVHGLILEWIMHEVSYSMSGDAGGVVRTFIESIRGR